MTILAEHRGPVDSLPDFSSRSRQHPVEHRGVAGFRCVVPVVFLATALAGCATTVEQNKAPASANVADGYQHERFRWEGPISADPDFRIDNPYGDIRVRTTGRGHVAVTAQVQQFGNEKLDIEITGDAASTIVVVSSVPKPRGRVDVTVLLPAGKKLSATTDSGLAELKYRGDIEVKTQSGRIFLKTGGHVQAYSQSGNIDLALARQNPVWPVNLQTNGDISAWFLRDASLELIASAARGISIEFPGIGPDYQPKSGKQIFGNGGAPVTLQSDRGQVRVGVLPPG